MRRAWRMIHFLVAGALLSSCQGNDMPATETLSVSPGSVEASAAMGSYKLEISSNAKWSVTTDASWMELDRSSGHDNAVMTIRVYENKLTTPREGTVTVRTAGGKEALATISQAGKEESGNSGIVLRLGSYNLRMSGLDKDADNVWDVRKERLKSSILACDFDVFGIQEVSTVTQAWLDSEFASLYTFCYFSPYSKDGKGDKAQGIGFKKSAFTLSDWHFFWACDTPDTMTENDTGSQGNYKRGGCCAVLTHKASGVKFFFMNNHGCLNAESNSQNAHVYAQQEQRFNPSGLPSIFVGDMNDRGTGGEGTAYAVYCSYWTDSFKALEASQRKGPAATYNGYSSTNGKYRLDYVFYRGEGITPQLYTCDNTLYGGLYASDHFPVWVEFEFR